MGGDSLAMDGWTRIISGERKVWQAGELLIGGSGVLSVVQKLKRTTAIPTQTDDGDPLDFLIECVVPEFRRALKAAEMSMTSDECDTALLIGYRGALYDVTPSFGITPVPSGLRGMGAGSDLAVGAFEAFMLFEPDWRNLIQYGIGTALTIAAKHNATVAPPCYVEHLGVAEAEGAV
jgi:hypothetical protein